MSQLRSDLWLAAFVRRHNDLGHLCVIVQKGDPIAGQIWIEIDHLDGTVSLLTPAPAMAFDIETTGRLFVVRLDRSGSTKVRERVARENMVDPDFWLISLEMRKGDPGLEIVRG